VLAADAATTDVALVAAAAAGTGKTFEAINYS
jgi:hypothetical protein